jgi:hypothetical protein
LRKFEIKYRGSCNWHITNLLNIVTAKKRPSLDAQKTRAIYKKRYKAKMKISVVFILLAFSSFNLHATTFDSGISNKSFERMCKEELEARNKDEFHMSFCISYLIGFIDGANNPKGCNMQDSSALVMRYIAFSEKVKTAYFGDTVRAFVSSGCNAL